MTTNDIIPDDDQPAYQPSREDLEDYEAALKLEAEQDCDCDSGGKPHARPP